MLNSSDGLCQNWGAHAHWKWWEIPELFGWDPLPSLGRIWPGQLPGKPSVMEVRRPGSVCKVLRLSLKAVLPEAKNLRRSQRLSDDPSLGKKKKKKEGT